jgi:cytochrome c-type biogenesis protein CcmE
MTIESNPGAPRPETDDELLADLNSSNGPSFPPEPGRPPRRRRKNTGRWVGFGLIVAVVALVASTVKTGSGAFTYSKYVDEVLAEPQRYVGTEIRVEGVVEAGSIQNTAGSNRYAFRVERNNHSMPVEYTGVVPDTFREGIGVTVRGRLASNGTFSANEVVAKCPSKYEMQAASARGQRMPGGIPGMGSPSAPH